MRSARSRTKTWAPEGGLCSARPTPRRRSPLFDTHGRPPLSPAHHLDTAEQMREHPRCHEEARFPTMLPYGADAFFDAPPPTYRTSRGETRGSLMKRRITALVATTVLLTGASATAWAAPSPPTQGGNGAGQSGQCTGNPADRPAVCPGT